MNNKHNNTRTSTKAISFVDEYEFHIHKGFSRSSSFFQSVFVCISLLWMIVNEITTNRPAYTTHQRNRRKMTDNHNNSSSIRIAFGIIHFVGIIQWMMCGLPFIWNVFNRPFTIARISNIVLIHCCWFVDSDEEIH